MALTRETIEETHYYVDMMKTNMQERQEQLVEAKNTIEANPNYQAWVAGTDYGASFAEKIEKLLDISNKTLLAQNDAMKQMDAFLERQEQINATGQ